MKEDRQHDRPMIIEIEIEGKLPELWSDWFSDLTVHVEQGSEGFVTRLRGPICDQAALFGILTRIRDLNLRLLSIRRLAQDPSSIEKGGYRDG